MLQIAVVIGMLILGVFCVATFGPLNGAIVGLCVIAALLGAGKLLLRIIGNPKDYRM